MGEVEFRRLRVGRWIVAGEHHIEERNEIVTVTAAYALSDIFQVLFESKHALQQLDEGGSRLACGCLIGSATTQKKIKLVDWQQSFLLCASKKHPQALVADLRFEFGHNEQKLFHVESAYYWAARPELAAADEGFREATVHNLQCPVIERG